MFVLKVVGLWIILASCVGIAVVILGVTYSLGNVLQRVAEDNPVEGSQAKQGLSISPLKRVPTTYHEKASAQLQKRATNSYRWKDLTRRISGMQRAVNYLMTDIWRMRGDSNNPETVMETTDRGCPPEQIERSTVVHEERAHPLEVIDDSGKTTPDLEIQPAVSARSQEPEPPLGLA